MIFANPLALFPRITTASVLQTLVEFGVQQGWWRKSEIIVVFNHEGAVVNLPVRPFFFACDLLLALVLLFFAFAGFIDSEVGNAAVDSRAAKTNSSLFIAESDHSPTSSSIGRKVRGGPIVAHRLSSSHSHRSRVQIRTTLGPARSGPRECARPRRAGGGGSCQPAACRSRAAAQRRPAQLQ